MDSDQDIFLPDEATDEADHLDFGLYVNALVDQVSSAKTQTPITLGIFGDWGSGKTTLMKLMQKELSRRQEEGISVRVESAWINVWQLSNQAELWNAFLQSLFTKVHARLGFWSRRRFNAQLFWERVNLIELFRQILANGYRIVIVVAPLLLAWILSKNQLPADITTASPFLKIIRDTRTGGAVSLVLGILLLGKPIVEAVKDKVTIDLKKILKDPPFEAQVSALQNLQTQFQKMVNAWVGETGRIVIFIDDLDRCSPDKVTEVLEALKLFATTRGCIYILGADQQVVARAIQIRYKELAGSSSNEMPLDGVRYLEKIIQVPFLLPLVEVDDINKYLNSFKIDWPHLGVVDSFARGLPPNPRLIKRAVNIYLLLWRLAEQRKEQKKVGGTITPLRLAKVVALQTAYPDAFEKLRDKPELLRGIEEFCQKSETERTAILAASNADILMSEMVKRPYVVALFSLQKDEPLALFSKLNPADLRAFFSLASQVAPTEKDAASAILTTEGVPAGIGGESTAPIPESSGSAQVGSPAGAALAIHQLPPPPRDFVGRENELDWIVKAINQGRVVILISGRGGTGKTALALKVAELVSPKFPDAQLLVDLRGTTDRMLSAAGAMEQVVRAYYPDPQITYGEDQISSLYRSVLRDKHGFRC